MLSLMYLILGKIQKLVIPLIELELNNEELYNVFVKYWGYGKNKERDV